MRSRTPVFLLDESASTTIELAIWTPLIAGTLMLVLDFSFMMTLNANMWNASRSAARAVSIHDLNATEAEAWARDELLVSNRPYEIDVTRGETDVVVTIRLAGDKAGLTPFLARVYKGDISASVRMLREPI
ncbi:TadE/TadG family type IV pilus assembly protein [Mesobacterium pallidum]|uniref:TadE/TadG family type IV pilus assembly protein n=1 Tax=Mesobacterium pallidum TaxID=2872037 RepID=UPI0023430B9D|nr:TadE family protein [Mesobacterium pallidum]